MRCVIPLAVLIAAIALSPVHPQEDDKPMKSALETNKKGFDDLPHDLEKWRRVPGVPKGKLAARDPWKFDKDGTLDFDGTGQEMLILYPGLKTNGIFHVEWRYKRAPAKGAATGGPVVRTSLKGDIWHQALAGNKAGAFFVGISTKDDKPAKVPTNKLPGPSRLLDPTEWNVYEITFKDKTLALFTNGYTTAEWLFCDVPKGYIGFKGDGAPIEFRNLKFKRLR